MSLLQYPQAVGGYQPGSAPMRGVARGGPMVARGRGGAPRRGRGAKRPGDGMGGPASKRGGPAEDFSADFIPNSF